MYGNGGEVHTHSGSRHLHLPHLHWAEHLHHPHWSSHHHLHGSAAEYVGRTGTLAVALGIGTVAATGCLACASAQADTGDRGSSGGSNTSTSQSVEANRRGPRSAASSVRTGSIRTPAGTAWKRGSTSQQAPAPIRERRSSDTSDRLTAPTEIHVNLPDAETAPAATGTQAVAAADVDVPATVVPAGEAPRQDATAPQAATTLDAAPKVFQPAAVPLHPAVAIATPAASSATLATTFSNVLTSLSNAINGRTHTLPADTSLALMLGAARRETAAPAAARSTIKTAASTATSSTTTPTVEAEKMTILRSGTARVVSDKKASGKSAMAVVGSGTVSTTVSMPTSTALTIRAKASAGSPNMTVSIDGVPITTVVVSSTSYADYTFAGTIPGGTHQISISSSNATSTSTLYLDKMSTSTGVIGDQFNGSAGSAANSTMWTTTLGTGWDSGIQNYTSSGAYLDGQGNLVIQSTKTASGGYTSGRVQTANKMSIGYGTVTARIKVPEGQALWPAFWMIGADEATNGWPAVGEIDVMELPSSTTTMYSTLHGPITGTTATQQAQIVSTLPDLSDDYHNYWVRHLENEITFGVDDQTLGTLTPADLAPGETWVYNRPMSLVINMAVGGPWAGAPDSTTPTTAKMYVDSVTYVPA